tara:strand:- start:50 stop:910 length:861 start_codon:yes stop_codon:yes gene_type:complete
MNSKKKYNPYEWWTAVGERSVAGNKDNAKFDVNNKGFSLYDIPDIEAIPKFFKYIKKDTKVLDIGSGIGYYVINLINRGITAHGCDISDSLLTICRQNSKIYNINSSGIFFIWDGHSLPFTGNSYDLVTTNTVLQHVINEKQIKDIFCDVSRVLKHNGYFCISELVSPKEFMPSIHVKQRTVENYLCIGKKYGFKAIEIIHYPKLYGSIFYLYTILFNKSKEVEVKTNNKPDSDFIYNQNNNKNILRLLSQLTFFITNNFLNPIVRLLKIEKYFHSQVDIVFKLSK